MAVSNSVDWVRIQKKLAGFFSLLKHVRRWVKPMELISIGVLLCRINPSLGCAMNWRKVVRNFVCQLSYKTFAVLDMLEVNRS